MPSAKKPGTGGRRAAKPAARPPAAKRPARRAAPRKAQAGGPGQVESEHRVSEETPVAREAAPRPRKATGPTITIEQYRSGIACPVRQKRVLRSLGLRHPRHRVVRPDNPAVRGMVNAIPHLVRIIVEGARGA